MSTKPKATTMTPIQIYGPVGDVLGIITPCGWTPQQAPAGQQPYSQIIYTINLAKGEGANPTNYLRIVLLSRNATGLHQFKKPILWQGTAGQPDTITVIHDYLPGSEPDASYIQIENGPLGKGSTTQISNITAAQA